MPAIATRLATGLRALAYVSSLVLVASGVAAAGLVLIATTARPAAAQTAVEWEPLPGFSPFESNRTYMVGFPSSDDGFRVLVGDRGEIYTWDDAVGWTTKCRPTGCIATELAIRDSVIMTGDSAGPGSGGALSLDGGETWEFDVFQVGPNDGSISALLWSTHPDTDGSLYVGEAFRLFRSDDLGREGTYVELGLTGGLIEDIAEVPPSAVLPNGRILAAVWNGLSFSDDGGQMFQSSNVYQQGGLIATSLSVVRDPTHPYGAVAYAAVTLAGEDPPFSALYRSDDGGATWEEKVRVPPGMYGLTRPTWGEVMATSDGGVWYGVRDQSIPGGDYGVVLQSEDGGETLTEAGTGYGRYAVHMMAEAPDGRVYVASDSLVWRTVDPVVAVAEEPSPRGASGLDVQVEPNPTTSQTTVRWRQARPGTARVTVHDVRGRKVLAIADSLYQPGEQAVVVETGALAPGVYVVRLVSSSGTVSARLTVAR